MQLSGHHFLTHLCPGEIEKTFFRYFPMGTNLRALLADIRWPENEEPEYQHMKAKFSKAFNHGSRGTLITDILSWGSSVQAPTPKVPNVVNLDDAFYTQFLQRMNLDPAVLFERWDSTAKNTLSRRVQFTRNVSISGVQFSPSKGDAYILFKTPGSGAVSAGKIEEIFLHSRASPEVDEVTRTEPYLIVKEYDILSSEHQAHDPFLRIPHLEANLCYNSFKATRVLKASDVISHFASLVYTPTDIDRECIVVLSLDRVCI